MATAFQPLPGYRELDCLGAVYVNDAAEANVRELVAESPYNDMVFVVEDPDVANALARQPHLAMVPLPARVQAEPPAPPKPPEDNLDGMTKDDLLKQPEAESIDGAKSMRVDDLRDKVRTVRQGGDA